jgi:hypothetical protein
MLDLIAESIWERLENEGDLIFAKKYLIIIFICIERQTKMEKKIWWK